MTEKTIILQRLHTQHLSSNPFARPEDAVRWLGAVQSQDFGAAKWALGLRLQNATDQSVEQAFAEGKFLRTHVMRPTWHFVMPEDILWMLKLTAPRVRTLMAYNNRQIGLTDAIFAHSHEIIVRTLRDHKQLTRIELVDYLKQAGILTDNLGYLHILMDTELEGLICSGARRGSQHTYALLSERAPQARVLSRGQALAELAKRYFTSHGPATIKDFAWWSGLTIADATAGLEFAKSDLFSEIVDNNTYWMNSTLNSDTPAALLLLPPFDEYSVGYTDRTALFDTKHAHKLDTRGNIINNYSVLIDGRVVGTWTRTVKKNLITIEMNLFRDLNSREEESLNQAAEDYGRFMKIPIELL